jgi:NAD(P)-dependent dehydrogenase (short-subunit alcohol dehydrogenase family)
MTETSQVPVAIVTGGAAGIGLAAVAGLAAAGMHVVALDLPTASFDGVDALSESADTDVVAATGDVTSADDWVAAVAMCRKRFGRIDVLFNNAGIGGAMSSLVDFPDASFDTVMAVNVRGVYLGMKHVVPTMLEQGSGSIINNASISGMQGSPRMIAYAASKHAVIGLTRSAAMELAPTVRVNAVCPAPTATAMMANLQEHLGIEDDDQFQKLFTGATPFGRFATADEIANVVVFLAGTGSSYMTGAIVPVDGGATAG